MAIVKVRDGYSLFMDNFDVASLLSGDITQKSTTRFDVGSYGDVFESFRGSGFKYGADGHPTAGTIKIMELFNGSLAATFENLNWSVADIVRVAKTSGQADDYKLEQSFFSSADTFIGNIGQDTFSGYGGNDRLDGGIGDDRLFGGDGNDSIIGGAGTDEMSGGRGADRFIFYHQDDSGQYVTPDDIVDFDKNDKIDLSAIDANGSFGAGNGTFHFRGSAAFTSAVGEVRFVHVSGDTYRVYADTDKDSEAEMTIIVHSNHNLSGHDFIL